MTNYISRNRRTFLAWSTPLVATIALPVHAQTSSCVLVDLNGTWTVTLVNTTVSITAGWRIGVVGDIFIIQNNGLILADGGTATINGSSISLLTASGTLTGTINSSCSLITGTVENNGLTSAFTAVKQ